MRPIPRRSNNGVKHMMSLALYEAKGGMHMDWRHQSACRDEDPELFFPVGNTGPALTQIEEAKKVCQRCIVKEPCLAWALESGQDAGVWGGLSEDERRALKRRAARNRARLMEQQNSF